MNVRIVAKGIFSTFLHARNFQLQQDKALGSCLDQWAHLAAAAGVKLPETEEVFGVLPNGAAEHVQEGAVDPDAQKARKHREAAMANALNDLFLEMQCAHTNTLDQAEGLRLLRMPGDWDCFYHTLQTLLAREGICEATVAEIRAAIIQELQDHRYRSDAFHHGRDYGAAVQRLLQTWDTTMGDFVVQAAADAWGVVIVVHQPHTDPIITVPQNPLRETILQVHLANRHYDALAVVDEADVQPEAVASGGEEDMDEAEVQPEAVASGGEEDMDEAEVQPEAVASGGEEDTDEGEVQPEAVASGGEEDMDCDEEEPEALSLPSVKAEVADEDIGDDRIGDIMQDLGPAEEGTKLNNVCVGVFAVMCVCVCVCVRALPPPPLPATVASLHCLA